MNQQTVLQQMTEHIGLASAWLERSGRMPTPVAIDRVMRTHTVSQLRETNHIYINGELVTLARVDQQWVATFGHFGRSNVKGASRLEAMTTVANAFNKTDLENT